MFYFPVRLERHVPEVLEARGECGFDIVIAPYVTGLCHVCIVARVRWSGDDEKHEKTCTTKRSDFQHRERVGSPPQEVPTMEVIDRYMRMQ